MDKPQSEPVFMFDGAIVGCSAIIAPGASVPPGKQVPPNTLWLGSPGKVACPARDEERDYITYAASHCRSRAKQYTRNGISFTADRNDT